MKRRSAAALERPDPAMAQRGGVGPVAENEASTHAQLHAPSGALAANGHAQEHGDASSDIDSQMAHLNATTTAATGDANSSSGELVGEETVLVKKRRTKNYKWREDMAKKTRAGAIAVRIPPLEPSTFATWEEFIQAWTEYMAQTKTLYRRRSSCSTASWNSKNRFKNFPVPDSFQYATMAYWCTHGCIQPSRGTGVRAHLHNRFTGCTARITADVGYEKTGESDVRWFIRVRNQISQHNHRISDEIYNCYTNNSSVPDELLLGAVDNSEHRHPDQQQFQQQRQRAQGQDPPSSSRPGYNLNTGDADFGGSSRTMSADYDDSADLDHVNQNGDSESDASRSGVPGAYHGIGGTVKEVLVDEQKINMARSELQPVLDELRRTPSRVIHKRLQDVSELVMHLLSKWHDDRTTEERNLHFMAHSAALSSTTDHQRPSTSRPIHSPSVHEDEYTESTGEELESEVI